MHEFVEGSFSLGSVIDAVLAQEPIQMFEEVEVGWRKVR